MCIEIRWINLVPTCHSSSHLACSLFQSALPSIYSANCLISWSGQLGQLANYLVSFSGSHFLSMYFLTKMKA